MSSARNPTISSSAELMYRILWQSSETSTPSFKVSEDALDFKEPFRLFDFYEILFFPVATERTPILPASRCKALVKNHRAG